MTESTFRLPVKVYLPCEPISRYVSHYGLRQGKLEDCVVLRPIYARTQQILEFYLLDRYQVRTPEGTWTAPEVLLAGPSTKVKGDLIYPRLIRTFTIHFHPAGLHALFRIPIYPLADKALPGESVLGREVSHLFNRLQNAVADEELAEAADEFLSQQLRRTIEFSPVELAARWMRRRHGNVDLVLLARQCNLSLRQFERQFRECVGVAPKLFSRVARLEFTLLRKQTNPGLSWTEVASDAGYFDQAHLIRDTRLLAGAAPQKLLVSLPDADFHSIEPAHRSQLQHKFSEMSHFYNSAQETSNRLWR
ncbi:MAG TPA: helix-turn-helix domain-containing protein [Terriglobales bacterium]|jgi:AraC-like DNA-binding protein